MPGSRKPRGILDWIARILLSSVLILWMVLVVLGLPGRAGVWLVWLLLPLGLLLFLWLGPRSGGVLRSLVELEVSLAVWVAVLYPVLGRRYDDCYSPQMVCLNHTKQLTLGLLVYASDYDGHLPPAPDWPLLSYPYVKNEQLFLCPEDKRPVKQTSGGLPTSYTLNGACGGLRIEDWPGAAALPMLFEGTALSDGPAAAAFRHKGKLSVGFADGHAKWLDREAFARLPFSPERAEAAAKAKERACDE